MVITMKKTYETAEITVFLFEKKDVVIASGIDNSVTNTTIDTDETELL